MNVVLLSKAMGVAAYQRKAEEIARQGVKLTVLVPPSWRDRRGRQESQAVYTEGYELRVIPIWFNGSYHLHFYPTLSRELKRLRPDVLHVDEEPYNLATWLAVRAGRRAGAVPTFFSWQNLHRAYPPPFRWMERSVYAACPVAMAGNEDASSVLQQKGYAGRIRVIPQFGVDPALFAPAKPAPDPTPESRAEPLQIGYAGGLIPEKGIDVLLRACAGLDGAWRLSVVGSGEEQAGLQQLARELGVAERVDLGRRVASHQMPGFYRGLGALVLPSRSQPNWKEQFGRVLIEAMACGVPVVGSDCGEIPNVVGEAGLVFPEDDVQALRRQLQRLLDDPGLRAELAGRGRRRVQARYTMARIAQQTVAVYDTLLKVGR